MEIFFKKILNKSSYIKLLTIVLQIIKYNNNYNCIKIYLYNIPYNIKNIMNKTMTIKVKLIIIKKLT